MIKKGLSTYREIPFNLAPNDIISSILKEQNEIAKQNKYNVNNYLFCTKDGSFITPKKITTTFKNICHSLYIQLDNPTGCYIHQA